MTAAGDLGLRPAGPDDAEALYRIYASTREEELSVGGEQVLGRLYVDRSETAVHVLDIALLPEHRGKGIGTRLMTEVLTGAGAAGRPVQIYVERFNPAQRLYDRLGFRQIADQGVYLQLQWTPGG